MVREIAKSACGKKYHKENIGDFVVYHKGLSFVVNATRIRFSFSHFLQFVRSFVLTLRIFKAPNYVLARTLTERVV